MHCEHITTSFHAVPSLLKSRGIDYCREIYAFTREGVATTGVTIEDAHSQAHPVVGGDWPGEPWDSEEGRLAAYIQIARDRGEYGYADRIRAWVANDYEVQCGKARTAVIHWSDYHPKGWRAARLRLTKPQALMPDPHPQPYFEG